MIPNGAHSDGNFVKSQIEKLEGLTVDHQMPPNGSEKPLPADPSREVPHAESENPGTSKDTSKTPPGTRSRLSVADAVDAMVKRGSMVQFPEPNL